MCHCWASVGGETIAFLVVSRIFLSNFEGISYDPKFCVVEISTDSLHLLLLQLMKVNTCYYKNKNSKRILCHLKFGKIGIRQDLVGSKCKTNKSHSLSLYLSICSLPLSLSLSLSLDPSDMNSPDHIHFSLQLHVLFGKINIVDLSGDLRICYTFLSASNLPL